MAFSLGGDGAEGAPQHLATVRYAELAPNQFKRFSAGPIAVTVPGRALPSR
jgi:hypothetical protein